MHRLLPPLAPGAGQLAKGGSSLSVESGLFRALAHPYAPPHTDFLLLRAPVRVRRCRHSNSRAARAEGGRLGWQHGAPLTPTYRSHMCARVQAGTMQLRELDSTVVVGQQLPMLRVPAPNAREVK